MIDFIQWVCVVVAVAGNVLVIKKQRAGLMCWIISNVGWILTCGILAQWPQVVQFTVFFCLAVWGWIEWRKPIE